MVLVVLAISLVNVGFGFGLAIYLGYGPPGLMEAWEALCTDPPAAWSPMAMAGQPITVASTLSLEPAPADAAPAIEAVPVPLTMDSAAEPAPSAEMDAAMFNGLMSGNPPAESGETVVAAETNLLDEIARLGVVATEDDDGMTRIDQPAPPTPTDIPMLQPETAVAEA